MPKRKPISNETKAFLRPHVLNGKSKSQVARDIGITFRTVQDHAKDISVQKKTSKKLIGKIREKIKNGKSKSQIAKELHLTCATVYYWTKDFPGENCSWPGLRGRTIDLLKEIVTKDYAYPTDKYVQQRYRILGKYVPTVRRITIYGKTICYLDGRQDEAVRAFLEQVNKKIIRYQELRQVTEVFGTDLNKSEKEVFLRKKTKEYTSKNKRSPKTFKAVLQEVQPKINDFLRRFLPSELWDMVFC
jgi:hypothetical protein